MEKTNIFRSNIVKNIDQSLLDAVSKELDSAKKYDELWNEDVAILNYLGNKFVFLRELGIYKVGSNRFLPTKEMVVNNHQLNYLMVSDITKLLISLYKISDADNENFTCKLDNWLAGMKDQHQIRLENYVEPFTEILTVKFGLFSGKLLCEKKDVESDINIKNLEKLLTKLKNEYMEQDLIRIDNILQKAVIDLGYLSDNIREYTLYLRKFGVQCEPFTLNVKAINN